ncbi:MAG TPA: hypothetical protein VFK43_21875, partial [Acidimicrobiales bacterium]|nr:hypothetical protein [Acidimicrobiales bacterium]
MLVRLPTRRRGAAMLALALVGAACGGSGSPERGVAAPTSTLALPPPPPTSTSTTRPCQPAPLEAR